MAGQLPQGEKAPGEDDYAYMFLQTQHQRELWAMPWLDFKSEIGFYLILGLANGEIFVICMRSAFKGQGLPLSFSKYAEGADRTHYFHRMPDELAKLLDGTRFTLVFESARSMRMLYHTTGFCPIRSDDLIGRYGYEPAGHTTNNWVLADEIFTGGFLDQFMDEEPVTDPADLERMHFSKMGISVFMAEGKMGAQTPFSIFWTKKVSQVAIREYVSKTALWTSPLDPPADMVKLCGWSVEIIWFNLHRFFLQYELGSHSYKRIETMEFLDQQHPEETRPQMMEHFWSYHHHRMDLAIHLQALTRNYYE